MKIFFYKPRIRYWTYLSIVISCLISCNRTANEERKSFSDLVKTDSFQVYIGKKYSALASAIPVSTDSTEYLAYLTKEQGTLPYISLYSISERMNVATIPLDNILSDSENIGDSNIKGFYFTNFDSVYVLNFSGTRLYLMDFKGSIKKSWKFKTNELVQISNENFPFVVFCDTVFMWQELNEPTYMVNAEARAKYYQTPVIAKYLLVDSIGVKQNEFGNYPDLYQNAYFYDSDPSVCFSPKGIYVSFGMKEGFRIYGYNGELINDYEVQSNNHNPELIDPFIIDSVMNYSFIKKYFAAKSYFGKTLFNPNDEIIFRVLIHVHDYIDKKTGLISMESEKPWSLQVIDANTNELLFEKGFQPREYSYRNIFYTGAGLCIAKYWENKPGLLQETVVFDVFTLK